jgi:hypothetical protein
MLVFSVNGRREVINTHLMPAETVAKWIEHLRTRSGEQIVRLVKPWHTESPSVQGNLKSKWMTFFFTE